MVKTVFKEIIIILLLCIAILLILSILFYDYNPLNKVVPNKIAYTVPDDIKDELQEENIQNNLTVENKIYTVEGSDLNIYKKSNSYVPGKANPFASSVTDEPAETNTTENTTGTKNNNNSNTNTSTNTGTKNTVSENKTGTK